ncbi:MAG TPA: 2-dehydro-3-deoxygalactonokinase [Casimicrobiaceae bacterium]|nr:2-dehydro-3-deoxygalactonokinase [Casimicrobiaceae bacterium]
MTEARRCALLAIDWGTTSARAYRLDATGSILATKSAPLGIQAVADRQFASALDTLLGEWRSEAVPRIACGMIGSRQGWIEAPYVDCPVDLSGLGRSLARTPDGELAIVPGALCRDASGIPDVMRGEETQVAGATEAGRDRMLAVLPGTHSKWAIVERGHLTAFVTFMTGELFAVLLSHSILGRMADRTAPASDSGDAFARGVAAGLVDSGFSHVIFGARTLALTGALAPQDVADWLSGALIGQEIEAARTWADERRIAVEAVKVIGGEALALRYASALAQAGIDAHLGPTDAAATGIFRIAKRAHLLG